MQTPKTLAIPAVVAGILITSIGSSRLSSVAAEVPFENGKFDASSSWYWEDWSNNDPARPEDVVAFDSTRDADGSTSSGSLRVVSNFIEHDGWQQSVLTMQLPGAVNVADEYGTLSFDVRVDPESIPSLSGNFGSLQVILRNSSGWEWKHQFPAIPLTSMEWQRVHVPLGQGANGGPAELPIDEINAVTLRLGGSDLLGPVMFNVDNITWNEDVVLETADNGVEDGFPPAGWAWEAWSQAGSSVTWDDLDASGSPTSGSIRLESAFEDVPGYGQAAYSFVLPGGQVNAAEKYSHINMDVKVDPASVPRAAGDYGYFEIFLLNGPTWDWIPTGPPTEQGTRLTTTDWTRISMPVRSGDAVHRLILKVGENAFAGPVILNVDNITWTVNTEPPAPPTLDIRKADGGLTLTATSTDQYGRHNIHTIDGLVPGWYDAGEPVTFSFTIDEYPDAAQFPGFQVHLFLVPGFPGGGSAVDWNEPTLIFLDLRAAADGSGSATFRWKANDPGSNTQLYSPDHPTVSSASVLGTWSLTALDNDTFVVTAPDGSTTEASLEADVAALFEGPIRAYLGVQPNSNANIGQSARFSDFTITQGSTILVEDDFSGGALDENQWVVNSSAGGVQVIAAEEAGFVLTWTMPDSGFVLETTSNLGDPDSWVQLEVAPYNVGATARQVRVPSTLLPEGNAAFFRLVKPAPEQ